MRVSPRSITWPWMRSPPTLHLTTRLARQGGSLDHAWCPSGYDEERLRRLRAMRPGPDRAGPRSARTAHPGEGVADRRPDEPVRRCTEPGPSVPDASTQRMVDRAVTPVELKRATS